ncbi:MAG: DMT family transporter [Nitrososphaerota archaeon]|nr:DMT family transporter [Aigarchaeota archaeon]MDW8076841.1 DMT family transporter [Nitrososphaerota archaeon]
MLGLTLSLLSAVIFGLNSVVVRRGLITGDVYPSVWISLIFAIPYTLVISSLTGEIWALTNLSFTAIIYFAIAGISNFLVVRYLIYMAIKLAGATVTLPIVSCDTLITVFLGIIVLGEGFSFKLIVATILVVIGIVLVTSRNAHVEGGRGSIINFKRGILYAILAMLSLSISSITIRLGTLETNTPSLGLLISNFFALTTGSVLLALPKYKEEVLSVDVKAKNYFLIGAFLVTTGQLTRYVALANAPVSLASPVINTHPLFTLILSYIFNRKLEVFDWKVLVGTPLVVIALILAFL